MSYEDFRHFISDVLNLPLEKIEKNSSLRDDLNVDSLQLVNLIVEVSSKYGIDYPRIQSNEDFRTVGNLYQMIMREI
ncbi:hypothetical protein CVD25_01350 [Bacillus canaveralius]|uniref:Carrier domain-containing protein n=1 Tax=Bacillus canaveralius TaxID=1403243 RepID=A0A2N5GN41_9BACI|nr:MULTISPECIES: acyl carrier protein [Bacillus]PLR78206.1 hypothetical protein CU633_06720 [Bacillus sp. V3-13]PLR81362.1 hypothetical protein CVD23_18920 [Bacillus sp. V33-4]PLR83551.1 hypothetical protein CU635_08970 [Bacillus canaveralius]PLS00737.1 hypothetical protein CVD25_01350 [Bacillus canaveralius]RSK48626.1 acyl carrier protein [Bacillus canaveralius]